MALLAATGYQVSVVSLRKIRCLRRCRCAAYSSHKVSHVGSRTRTITLTARHASRAASTRKRPRTRQGTSQRRPPSYPSRLHNAWTTSSRSTRPAVHARSDRWSCLQGCGRAANATRLHAAQLSAATKGCPDPAALSRGSPRSAARGGPAAVVTRNGPPAAARRPLVTP